MTMNFNVKCPKCGCDKPARIVSDDETGIDYTVSCGRCGLSSTGFLRHSDLLDKSTDPVNLAWFLGSRLWLDLFRRTFRDAVVEK